MEVLDLLRQPIEEELHRYHEVFVSALESDTPLLSVALRHLVQREGKRMRPLLVLLAAKGAGQVTDEVLHAAVALELLHTASLVHDDVVDESDRRRGQKSVNALLDNKAAVLVGDYILSKALEHATLTGNVKVVNLVSCLGQTLAEGELIQLANTERTDFNTSSYYEVIRKKTASLFSTCAEAGAILAGADEGYRYSMKRFGMLVGMCFQLRDDIFDFEDKLDVGKPAGNDMKEGKLTLPVLYVAQKNEEAARLGLLVRQGRGEESDIARLVQLSREEGGIVFAEKTMEDFADMARGLLSDVTNEEIRASLASYLDFVSKRNI